jgi:YcaO-like protein with predicted kinase domain
VNEGSVTRLHQFGSAHKSYHTGTHRTRSPQETLDAFLPRMWDFGITRLADVTGLDVIGMPVYMAVRPNSRSLSVSQGKGVERAAAKASALMESIEGWHAEHADLPIRYESYSALRRSSTVIDVTRLPLRRGAVLDFSAPMLWVMGYDLIKSCPTWLPYECVSLNFVRPDRLGTSFRLTSNGLASGNHVLEAIMHALCEVIERDALALWEARGGLEIPDPQVDLTTVDEPVVAGLLKQLHNADISVAVLDVTSDTAVPAFTCILADDGPMEPRWTLKGLFAGHGSHLDPLVALMRAITEAVQGRLTHIAGSRDDMFHYDTQANLDDIRASTRLFARAAAPFTYSDLSNDSFESDIETILQNLQSVGIESAVLVDLTRAEVGIPVVKLVVPGLESEPHSASYVPGERAISHGGTI